MKNNNYDMSSTGVSIEVSIGYDTDMSAHDWQENFAEVVPSGYRKSGVYQYIQWGNYETLSEREFKEIDSNATLKRDLLQVVLDEDYTFYTKTELRQMSKDELIDLIQDSILDDYDLEEAMEWASGQNIALIIDNYEIITTRGYSQGDYAEVIVPDDGNNYSVEIGHYFWDAPIYARVTVDGEEYYIDENMECRYEWDKDEAIAIVQKWDISDGAKAQICEMLPEEPSYD